MGLFKKFYLDSISLLKLSATPVTIVYPYPFLATLAFSLSDSLNIISLIKGILLSSIFYSGINLWNHVNDIEEDKLAGKKTVLTNKPEMKNSVILVSIILYVTSFFTTINWVVDVWGIIAFCLVLISTWVYSDKHFLGKMFRRWKEHYGTEVLTYVISVPSFSILLWTIYTPISIEGFSFAIIITFFMLSGMFLKDIKDSSGDLLAGLRTLSVVFTQETLLKISLTLIGFYYISILTFSVFGLLPFLSFLSVIASIGYIITLKHFRNNKWEITLNSLKTIKLMIYSNLTSLTILILVGLVNFTLLHEL